MKNHNVSLLVSIIISILLITGVHAKAQKVEISPVVGYNTGAKIMSDLGHMHISNGVNFGFSADIGVGSGRYAEISYSHMAAFLGLKSSFADQRICNLSVNYVSIGAMQEIIPGAKATPYGLLALGLINYNPITGDYTSLNNMFINIAGGFKIRATDRIGMRLQAGLILPYYNTDTYFQNGTGGAGYEISGGIKAIQGDIKGSLVIFLK